MKSHFKVSSAVVALAVAAVLVAFAGTAVAIVVGPDCTSCNGGEYRLDANLLAPVQPGDNTEKYRVSYLFNMQGWDYSPAFVNTVGVKVSSSVVSAALVNGPTAGWGVLANQGVNANGCSSGGGGFVCATWGGATGFAFDTTTDPFRFVFDITVPTGTFFTDLDGASIKALFVTENGNKVGAVLSETASPVPEPATLLLLGSGLAGLAGIGWRRNRK